MCSHLTSHPVTHFGLRQRRAVLTATTPQFLGSCCCLSRRCLRDSCFEDECVPCLPSAPWAGTALWPPCRRWAGGVGWGCSRLVRAESRMYGELSGGSDTPSYRWEIEQQQKLPKKSQEIVVLSLGTLRILGRLCGQTAGNEH